jgi:excinuclease ABC subunit C
MTLHKFASFLENVTALPGVYQMLDVKGEVIYVGKAKNLKKRLSSYFSKQAKDLKTESMLKHVDSINITVAHSENEAVILECNLIKKYRPRYNVLLRDDKSYPYIAFTTAHPFPRIESYRGVRRKGLLSFGPFPSGLAVRETLQLLQKIFKIRTCRDAYFASRSRPCLLYQIGRCTAPCVDYVSKEAYADQVALAVDFLEGKASDVIHRLQARMEQASITLDYESAALHRDQIARLRQMQDKQAVNLASGHADLIGLALNAGVCCVQLLTVREGQVITSRTFFPAIPHNASPEEIMSAFIKQHYFSDVSHQESIPREIITTIATEEDAELAAVLSEVAKRSVVLHTPKRGEKVKWRELALQSATQSLAAHLLSRANMQARMKALCERLQLKKTPHRLFCFDISHTMGEATTASCVVFDKDGPVKAEYRRLNITDITPGDDVAAMRSAITRRFKRLVKESAVLPDVLFIDGGQTQLNAAAAVMESLGLQDCLLVGVSKGPGRKAGFESLHRLGQAPMHLASDDLALHLIQHIRDEAHRFAIAGHRARRDKTRHTSRLEGIPGIGAKRRRDLLRYFGGIQGVAHASLDELLKVAGISRPLAERIFAAFHDTTA